jgi:hypothetical protein
LADANGKSKFLFGNSVLNLFPLWNHNLLVRR